MKRTQQMRLAGTPSARNARLTGNKPWRVQMVRDETGRPVRDAAGRVVMRDEPPHYVRSLSTVGGKRPNANAKRRKHMANRAGFPTWEAWQKALLEARGVVKP